MKLNNFLIIFASLLTFALTGQENGPTIYVDLDISPTGEINRVQLPGPDGQTIGNFLFRKSEDGLYELGLDYSPINAEGLRLQFVRNGRTLYSQEIPGGPHSSNTDLNTPREEVYEASFSNADEDAFWIGILAVAYCCVEITVNSNGDGTYSSSLTFDCDCISLSLSGTVYDSDGEEYHSIDEVIISSL